MRTIKGEKITKKEIERVIRDYQLTFSPTAIYRLHYRIFGNVEQKNVYNFVEKYAPSKTLKRCAFAIAYPKKHENYRVWIDDKVIRKHGIYHGNDLIEFVGYLKKQCADASSSYAKRPMLGNTHLYFCSPIFGHSDYNKVRSIPIAGNERLCELAIKYADKYFAPIYEK